MLTLIGNFTAAASMNKIIIDVAMYFGLFVIVAMALNFQYGNAGVPNMGCAVQVIMGGVTVSAITTRLVFFILRQAGINLLPYTNNYDWIYNNQINVEVLSNAYLKERPVLSIALLAFSLAFSLVLGAAMGWLIALPAIRLQSTHLMVILITMSDAAQTFSKNIPWFMGGTMGVYVPNVFAWFPGDRGFITSAVTLFIGLISFFIFRTMINSPYGRLMRALRENEITLRSVGKNAVSIRRNILMFASGITALSGVLLAFYFSFVVGGTYQRSFWTYWPWLMLILGGPGNNLGTFLGCALIVGGRRLIMLNKWFFSRFFFFPVTYFENILLGLLLIIIMMFRPEGLVPETLLSIRGINYEQLLGVNKSDIETRTIKNKVIDFFRNLFYKIQ
jgi:branched-chain amino acid transport system permease protein